MSTAAAMNAAKIHLTLAALMGLAGVTLLAAAAHGPGTSGLQTAGQMLLTHAPVILGATAARKAGLLADLLARVALSVIILGVALFAADLTRRGFYEERLFAGAAPAGGFLMLAGWLALTVSALFARRS
ncbi:Hypothetical protein precursor [Bosea sp. LC85]|uniref:DUF423 domain-containing protein n=1 Tax=Bosea sp. LC85 TaxID=1502851 RepID=UPI0004E2E518|nr:DUF423 domain-containing protein [Bosea sp. LC85]KFC70829.1 Hypothetical protein precursor [Bosea sp. LC85]